VDRFSLRLTSAYPDAVRLGTPELDEATALQEAADAAMGAGDIDGAIGRLSTAVRLLTTAGDNRRAAMTCVQIAVAYYYALGNRVAARPWFNRAMRLVADEEPCVEQGYVALATIGCDVDDPAELAGRAALALDRARRFGDVDLEVKALADGGLAHVQAGRVAEGMAMLDEAMALACGGETKDEDVVCKSVCSFYTACYVAADFERVEAWTRVLRERAVLAEGRHLAFSSSHCESVRGTLLCDVGRWSEAEDLLLRAYADVEQAMPGQAWHPPIALAELRIRQGRLAEAEALLLGRDDHMQALLPTARLHLARGDFDLAAATARRGLRLVREDKTRGAALLGVLVEAELGRGAVDRAAVASADLDGRIAGLRLPALEGEAARQRARVYAAQGDVPSAITALQDGLDALAGVDVPLLRMSLHIDLARLHESAGEHADAVVEARSASALLARLDVVLNPEDAALLDRLGAGNTPRPVSVACRVATLARDGDWWTAGCGDTRVRLRDTKGMRYLADVVAHPGVERHAMDLVDLVEGVAAPDTRIDRRTLGDAGQLLDAQSRTLYRRLVAELRDQVEDALDAGDDDRAAALQTELDALITQLARAFGLGGRERKASDAAQKARLNVTRALRAAIAKLQEALPGPGAVLDRRVRTGMFCAYEPQPEDEILWSVQSGLNTPPRS
jgi:tetratricopeptide (TPR) repeat protein